jgi:hypothetical protein
MGLNMLNSVDISSISITFTGQDVTGVQNCCWGDIGFNNASFNNQTVTASGLSPASCPSDWEINNCGHFVGAVQIIETLEGGAMDMIDVVALDANGNEVSVRFLETVMFSGCGNADCSGECGGSAVVDECGVCGGSSEINECGDCELPFNNQNNIDVGTHSMALLSDRTVVSWGYNAYGQTDVPDGLSNVLAISVCP